MIWNITKETIVAGGKTNICRGLLAKCKGLMFEKKVKPTVLCFKNRKIMRLHTFFVPAAIDVILLDPEFTVVEVKEHIEPRQFYKSRKPAMFAIEVSSGAVAESSTSVGDIVNFK